LNTQLHSTQIETQIQARQLADFVLYDEENPFKFVGRGVTIKIIDTETAIELLDTTFRVPCG
jgi:hypothetical protein